MCFLICFIYFTFVHHGFFSFDQNMFCITSWGKFCFTKKVTTVSSICQALCDVALCLLGYEPSDLKSTEGSRNAADGSPDRLREKAALLSLGYQLSWAASFCSSPPCCALWRWFGFSSSLNLPSVFPAHMSRHICEERSLAVNPPGPASVGFEVKACGWSLPDTEAEKSQFCATCLSSSLGSVCMQKGVCSVFTLDQ